MSYTKDDIITVGDIMTRNVVTFSSEDSLDTVAKAFDKYEYDGFPIIDTDQKMVGIITAYDMVSHSSNTYIQVLLEIVSKIYKEKGNIEELENHVEGLKKIKIKEVMNIDPLVIRSDAKIEDLAKEFTQHHKVNPIPVIDDHGKLLGVVSRYDIIKFYNENFMKDILKDLDHNGVLRRLTRLEEE